MKTQNLSIVFIDIVGFTPRTSSQTRDENEQMLRRFSDAVKPLVRAYKGNVIKTIGDAFLLTFHSPTDALLCCTAIHDRLTESNTEVPDADRFEIRAAVNVGEVRVEGGDVFGEAVNIAARIEGQAGAGEIYFSEAVYLAMTRSEVPTEEVGYTELKGIPEKVRLYRVPHAGAVGAYSLASRDDATPDKIAEEQSAIVTTEQNSLAPSSLPFAGLGLTPVRSKLSRPSWTNPIDASQIEAVQGGIGKLSGGLQLVLSYLQRGFAYWRVEVKRSRLMQIGTAVVVIALVAALSWGMLREKPKPLTRWQKIQRGLGI